VTSPVDAVVKGPGLYRIHTGAVRWTRFAYAEAPECGSVSGYLTLLTAVALPEASAATPDVVVVRRYASAAAGAYQFLPATGVRHRAAWACREF